ncbi:MAG: transporter [Gammaproteobacteria bacterium]|nr:transporter [Gammaproteobacteria bacterium]
MPLLRIILLILCICPHGALADHASVSFETGAAGAIMTIPGATLPKGKTVFGFGVQFIDMDEISDGELEALGAADEDVHSVDNLLNLTANLAYGITDNLTVGASMPYIERNDIREAHNDMGAGEVEFAGDSVGIGDLSLFGQYRFYHNETQDMALIAGLKTPTGDTSEREAEGGFFGTEQQPGSGSRDPFFGMAYDRKWGRAGFSGNVLYTLVNEGSRQSDLGDIFNYNLAVTYRTFAPTGGHNHHRHTHGFGIIDYVDVMLEANGDYRERAEINNISDEHTGGHTLYISPGARVGIGHKWSFFGSLGVPVVNNLNGQQSEPEYRVIGGLSFTF